MSASRKKRLEELRKQLNWEEDAFAELLEEIKKFCKGGEQQIYVRNILRSMNCQIGTRGANFIEDAIVYCIENDLGNPKMSTEVYPWVAQKYGVTVNVVTNLICKSVERIFANYSVMIEEVFGAPINPTTNKITSKRLILAIAKYVRDKTS